MSNSKPAIVAVGYNRPKCMKRLLDSIGNACYSETNITLIVSIDESAKSDEVQKVAEDFNWVHGKKIIRRFPRRQGLKQHIIQCGDLSNEYGSVIILEDDLVVSPGFYSYAQQAHDYYDNDERIAGVSLYANSENIFVRYRFMPVKNAYDVYFGQYIVTWGQSWSSMQWNRFKEWFLKHEEKMPAANDAMPREILEWTRSWGKYFISYMVENNLFYVIPYTALSTNFSEQGEHRSVEGYQTAYQVRLLTEPMTYRFCMFEDGIKYDSFFERIPGKDSFIDGIDNAELCIDLNGNRVSALGKKYLLTCKSYQLPLVRTYGLRMRPIDDNITYSIEGHGINLYQIDRKIDLIPRSEKRRPYVYDAERIRYEAYGMTWRQLLPYIRKLLGEAFRRKLGEGKQAL